MSKFLLNLHLQISQALVNSKSNFYSKRILPPNSAHSAQPACPIPRPWPAGRPKPSNPPRPKPPSPLGLSAARPAHAFSVFYRRHFFSSVHAFPSRPPPPRFSDNWALVVSFVPHLQPPELACSATDSRSPSAAPLRASGALAPLPPRLHFPSHNSPP
jgi:hypothetical protein